jgi:hypothetical protein
MMIPLGTHGTYWGHLIVLTWDPNLQRWTRLDRNLSASAPDPSVIPEMLRGMARRVFAEYGAAPPYRWAYVFHWGIDRNDPTRTPRWLPLAPPTNIYMRQPF